MNNTRHIIVTAHCDKAARENNEDNCLVRINLLDDKVDHQGDGVFLSKCTELGKYGSLLILADGMGGMNAGEVASAVAVSSTSNYFTTQMPEGGLPDDEAVFEFLKQAVTYSDECIKAEGAKNPDSSGLGTTIVVLWLLDGKAYIGWCGDSRIYRYNTVSKEVERLSHDHSLVQFWVDSGQLTEEEAFRHPQSNIIMRSLSDSPDSVDFETLKTPLTLHSGDVFLICSDGLCGVLRDTEIESLLNKAAATFPPAELDKWNDLLWEGAENARWSDNVTSILCHVSDEEEDTNKAPQSVEEAEEANDEPETDKEANPATVTPSGTAPLKKAIRRKRRIVILVIALVLLTALAIAALRYLNNRTHPASGAKVHTSGNIQQSTNDNTYVIL